MGITLITGPANAGKAELILAALRRHVAHGEEPLLVVPTRADVERYRRELADSGLVLGARVERFGGLVAEVVLRAVRGSDEALTRRLAREPLSADIRERILTQLALGMWPASAFSGRGLSRALSSLVVELEVARVDPARLDGALGQWLVSEERTHGPDGRLGTIERVRGLARVYEGYRATLERLGRLDPELRTSAALDVLRRSPALWRGSPVLFYGFDDLTPLQLDTLETLGGVVGAPVTVSLAYEPGRAAFAGRASTFQTLLPLADEHRSLPARAEHYAESARAELHHLERELFEQREDLERLRGGGAIRMLEGGGERAELELVASTIKGLIEGGLEPGAIAIVHRSPASCAALIAEVLSAFEIPFALERSRPFSHTALGKSLLGLLACACGGEGTLPPGEAGDLLTWLRAPGLLEQPELADALEVQVRRSGAASAEQARALWEVERWPLSEIDRMREASARGPAALIGQLSKELDRLFQRPRRRSASVLEGHELDDARALGAAARLLGELRELARVAPELIGGSAGLANALGGLEIVSGDPPSAATVAVVDPLALRARRVSALFLCGLQEGVFPSNAPVESLLGEEERRGLAEASDLRLSPRADHLAAERYLLYATVSRPEQLLVLSWHGASDDERAVAPSLFVDDVRDLFEGELFANRSRRSLGAADWPGGSEPNAGWAARERALSLTKRLPAQIAPLHDEQLLASMREGRLWSASALELWTRCPVRWLIERLLGAKGLEPDPEPLARGALAHAVLRDVLAGLRSKTGSATLSRQRLELARELLHEALSEHAERHPLSVASERVPGVRRRLELDLERYLAHAAEQESPLQPQHLELPFGFPDEPEGLPAFDLGDGVLMRGRIDRVDVGREGEAVVYDYKGEDAPAAARWIDGGYFQIALYMNVVEQLLGAEVIGGLYQPLRGRDLRARGAVRADRAQGLGCVSTDLLEPEEFERLVSDSVELARKAASEADAGTLEARPETCGFGGSGCAYPTICRCER